MKKALFILLIFTVMVGCKNDKKSEDTILETKEVLKTDSNIKQLRGSFVYYDGAAVLQTQNKIYGVYLTDKLDELNKLAETYKTEPTDMVTVKIKGKISNKKDDKILWEDKVEILEIISVTKQAKDNNNVVKLGNK